MTTTTYRLEVSLNDQVHVHGCSQSARSGYWRLSTTPADHVTCDHCRDALGLARLDKAAKRAALKAYTLAGRTLERWSLKK